MRWYTGKVYEGCPVPTILWNITGLISCVSGVSGFLCLYYVFFPKEGTNHAFVLAGAVIGIPLFIICLLLKKPIDKLGEKQLKEREKKEAVSVKKQGANTVPSRKRRYTSTQQYRITWMTLGIVMLVCIFCIFYSHRH